MRFLFLTIITSIVLFSCSNSTDDNEVCIQATVTQVGETVQGFSLTTLDGNIVNTDSLKDKTIFLNFFTLSCPMCMLELPQLEKQIWEKYKNRDDIVFLTIGREHTNEELEKFYSKKGFTFPMATDADRSVYALFGEKCVPRNIIINKEGKVAFTSVGYNEEEGLDEIIDAIKYELGE